MWADVFETDTAALPPQTPEEPPALLVDSLKRVIGVLLRVVSPQSFDAAEVQDAITSIEGIGDDLHPIVRNFVNPSAGQSLLQLAKRDVKAMETARHQMMLFEEGAANGESGVSELLEQAKEHWTKWSQL